MIEIFPVAHLHDLGFEVFHSSVRAAMFAPGTGICRSVHVGQQGYFLNTQRIDNDMNMDIAAVVVSVRVDADNGLVSGEMLGTKLLAHCLVFPIAEIGAHTGNGKILAPAIQRSYAVILPRYQPPVFIKGGLHGKLVMFKCEIGFRCAIVRIFRADMFECCQQHHPLSARLQTLGRQGRKPPPAPPRQCHSFSVRAIWFKLPPILPYSAVSFPTAASSSSLT